MSALPHPHPHPHPRSQSGFGRHATQASAGNQPQLVLASNGIPGYSLYFPADQSAYLSVAVSVSSAAVWAQFYLPSMASGGMSTVFGNYPADVSFRIWSCANSVNVASNGNGGVCAFAPAPLSQQLASCLRTKRVMNVLRETNGGSVKRARL